MRRWPSAVTDTLATRRSIGSTVRSTSPSSANLATMRVIVGGATCSMAASSPSVSVVFTSIEASTECWDGERPVPACWRSWRPSRATANLSRAATSSISDSPVISLPRLISVAKESNRIRDS
jgi:hypothetical protein